MKTHTDIDRRSLALAGAVVDQIDSDPARDGLSRARALCQRWYQRRPEPAHKEWLEILEHPWEEIRDILLEDSETGQRLRQNSPFCGVLTVSQRWQIYKSCAQNEA